MSQPAPRQALQQRVAGAIVEAAARVFAERGEHASMNDVAAAAGFARATVYRYFPNRQALVDELMQLAVRDAEARLRSARIDEVSVVEGVTRAVRALVDVGDYFVVLARQRARPAPADFERAVAVPLRELFERGQTTGVIRDDMPGAWLTESLIGLIASVRVSAPALGREDTVAAIASLFLDGASARGPRLL